MSDKRILTIQDISCVGQCSMTVALPVLSVCGHETCILPTAVLSTHTGGFGKPAIRHLENLEDFWHHWKKQNITFDAILVGYLGNLSAIQTAMDIIDNLLAPGGIAVVDPAMGDKGRLYSGFDMDYVQAMKILCQKADIILPNITEAALLTDSPYSEVMDKDYVNSMIADLSCQNVVLTGISDEIDRLGAALYQNGSLSFFFGPRVEGSYHGTGDLFAACLIGSLMQGKNLEKSVEIAVGFTEKVLENTKNNPLRTYGLRFEPLLSLLPELLKE